MAGRYSHGPAMGRRGRESAARMRRSRSGLTRALMPRSAMPGCEGPVAWVDSSSLPARASRHLSLDHRPSVSMDASHADAGRDVMSLEDTSVYAELEERLRFETLIADLSSIFVNLPATDVDREITSPFGSWQVSTLNSLERHVRYWLQTHLATGACGRNGCTSSGQLDTFRRSPAWFGVRTGLPRVPHPRQQPRPVCLQGRTFAARTAAAPHRQS